MTRRRTAILVTVGVLVLALGGGAVVVGSAAPVATGYAARIGCGVVLLQGRPVGAVVDELPSNPLVPFLRVEERDGAVAASLLGWSTTRSAPAGDGGCRILGPDDPVPDVDVPPMEPRADDLVVPTSPATEAANAGIDTTLLAAAVTRSFAEPVDPELGLETRAVVVVHRGTVVAERYAEGFDAETPLLGWSMTKSVAETMVGRLAADGLLSLDETVPGVWPADDPRSEITWDQLLTMTDGLAFDETYAVGTDATTMLFTDVDAGAFAADKPLVAEPGTSWSYSSGTSNILCDALTTVAGGDPDLLARRLVFEPLAMTSATIGTAGGPVCSSFAYATARDWARFGLLYEQGGVWGGRQLLPAGWVEEVTTAPVTVGTVDPDTGEPTPYARHWWLNTGPDGTRMPEVPDDAFFASGNEGQNVAVVPSRDLVVVRLAIDQGTAGVRERLGPLLAGVVDAVDAAGGSD